MLLLYFVRYIHGYMKSSPKFDRADSSIQKRAKRQPDDNLQQLEATSIDAAKNDHKLMGAEFKILN